MSFLPIFSAYFSLLPRFLRIVATIHSCVNTYLPRNNSVYIPFFVFILPYQYNSGK